MSTFFRFQAMKSCWRSTRHYLINLDLEYLKSCIEQEIQKQNSQTFLNGCRKYNLSLRKQIENILIALQTKQINRLKDELGIEHVPASTFNPANYLKKHFDTLQ